MADRRRNDPYNPQVNYYPETQDVVVWQRMRDMVLREALNPAWVNELNRLHHMGKIHRDELLASERYAREVKFWNQTQGVDPDIWKGNKYRDEILDNRELMRKIRTIPSTWRDRLDDIVLRCQVISFQDLKKARNAMILLKTFFDQENKTRTKIA